MSFNWISNLFLKNDKKGSGTWEVEDTEEYEMDDLEAKGEVAEVEELENQEKLSEPQRELKHEWGNYLEVGDKEPEVIQIQRVQTRGMKRVIDTGVSEAQRVLRSNTTFKETSAEVGFSDESEIANKFQALHKCPFCFIIFAVADGLKEHLPGHSEEISRLQTSPEAYQTKKKNSTIVKMEETAPRPRKIIPTRRNKLISTFQQSEPEKQVMETKYATEIKPVEVITSIGQVEAKSNRRSKRIIEMRSRNSRFSEENNILEPSAKYVKVENMRTDQTLLDGIPPCRIVLTRCDENISSNFELLVESKDEDGGGKSIVPGVKTLPTKQKVSKQHGKGKLPCSICFKKFPCRGSLEFHSFSHTKERNFKCPLCPKSFTQPGNVNLHIRTHTREKPYKCKICSRAFAQISQLQHHMPTHQAQKPYKCQQCPQTFSQEFNLKLHILRHAGKKPYTCPICSKAFGGPGALKLHKELHNEDRPFKCSICSCGYTSERGLKAHIRVVHCLKG